MPFDADREAEALRKVLKPRGDIRQIVDQLENIPVATLVVDDGGRYIGANQRACELTGYTRAELLARSVADITHSIDLPAEERLWRAFERTRRQSGRYTLAKKDGATLRVDYEAFWDLGPGIHVSFLNPATQESDT